MEGGFTHPSPSVHMGEKMKLAHKTAIITGSGSGIGKTTALLFADEGARVIVADIDTESGNDTVERIMNKGGDAAFVRTDVSKAEDVKNMVRFAVSAYSRIDILVNIAGIFTTGTALDTSEQEWDRILGVNLLGVFLCTKYCVQEMVKTGGGSVVNIASEAGLVAIRNQVAYNVSKSGVVAFTKSAAVDFADKNIRVNCVCPGRVFTPLVEKVIKSSEDPEAALKELSEDRPLKRMGKPEEIAAGILFLASDDAKYAIGTVLSIDGGYTAW